MLDLRSSSRPCSPEFTDVVAHRPWPMPRAPWIMAQRWSHLLFAHWPVDAGLLRPLVPPALPVDVRDGTAWLTITPFLLSGLRPRGLPPIPGLSRFPELNVRTYVTSEEKPGVFFLILDAASALAVAAARTFYHLPYHRAAMRARVDGNGAIQYVSRRLGSRTPAEFVATYRPAGAVLAHPPGSLEHWLTERYCLYALDATHGVHRAEIHHLPWQLEAVDVEIERNTMAAAAGISLPAEAPRVAFARTLDVVVWWPVRVARST
jgi:uncharacterized protein